MLNSNSSNLSLFTDFHIHIISAHFGNWVLWPTQDRSCIPNFLFLILNHTFIPNLSKCGEYFKVVCLIGLATLVAWATQGFWPTMPVKGKGLAHATTWSLVTSKRPLPRHWLNDAESISQSLSNSASFTTGTVPPCKLCIVRGSPFAQSGQANSPPLLNDKMIDVFWRVFVESP